MPHVCCWPTVIEDHRYPPATGTGPDRLRPVDPSPPCPSPFQPQQYAGPAAVTPQLVRELATKAVQSVAIAPGGMVEVGVALKNGVAENAGFGVMVAVGVFDGVHVRVAVRVSVMVGVSEAVEVREAVGLTDADGLGNGVAVGYSPEANPGSDRLNVVPSPN